MLAQTKTQVNDQQRGGGDWLMGGRFDHRLSKGGPRTRAWCINSRRIPKRGGWRGGGRCYSRITNSIFLGSRDLWRRNYWHCWHVNVRILYGFCSYPLQSVKLFFNQNHFWIALKIGDSSVNGEKRVIFGHLTNFSTVSIFTHEFSGNIEVEHHRHFCVDAGTTICRGSFLKITFRSKSK